MRRLADRVGGQGIEVVTRIAMVVEVAVLRLIRFAHRKPAARAGSSGWVSSRVVRPPRGRQRGHHGRRRKPGVKRPWPSLDDHGCGFSSTSGQSRRPSSGHAGLALIAGPVDPVDPSPPHGATRSDYSHDRRHEHGAAAPLRGIAGWLGAKRLRRPALEPVGHLDRRAVHVDTARPSRGRRPDFGAVCDGPPTRVRRGWAASGRRWRPATGWAATGCSSGSAAAARATCGRPCAASRSSSSWPQDPQAVAGAQTRPAWPSSAARPSGAAAWPARRSCPSTSWAPSTAIISWPCRTSRGSRSARSSRARIAQLAGKPTEEIHRLVTLDEPDYLRAMTRILSRGDRGAGPRPRPAGRASRHQAGQHPPGQPPARGRLPVRLRPGPRPGDRHAPADARRRRHPHVHGPRAAAPRHGRRDQMRHLLDGRHDSSRR